MQFICVKEGSGSGTPKEGVAILFAFLFFFPLFFLGEHLDPARDGG